MYVREGKDNDRLDSHSDDSFSRMAYHIVHNPVFAVVDLIATVSLMLLALIEDPPIFNIPMNLKGVVVTVSELITTIAWLTC